MVGKFHLIWESLPGIVTSHGGNLLKLKMKLKMCNNLLLIATNFMKIMQEIDWTVMKRLRDYQWCVNKTVSVTDIHF